MCCATTRFTKDIFTELNCESKHLMYRFCLKRMDGIDYMLLSSDFLQVNNSIIIACSCRHTNKSVKLVCPLASQRHEERKGERRETLFTPVSWGGKGGEEGSESCSWLFPMATPPEGILNPPPLTGSSHLSELCQMLPFRPTLPRLLPNRRTGGETGVAGERRRETANSEVRGGYLEKVYFDESLQGLLLTPDSQHQRVLVCLHPSRACHCKTCELSDSQPLPFPLSPAFLSVVSFLSLPPFLLLVCAH
ncbi:hypothetical protein JZ751_001174 [Albula glossodonta]|uniref:Uncharacterized protein n=1 Tax=Albula glossodonta TaxID=121402 RepID=A0A8T2PSZ1_9TELE|nr:hypothetical protein JZ751_001174 [Albula glossodonta]